MIQNYGDAGALAILVGLMVWYLKYQTRRQAIREDKLDAERARREEKRDKEQKEERDYYRNIISNELKKNVELNVKAITLQKEMIKDFKSHSSQSEIFSKKVVETLSLMCDKMNGNNRKIIEAKNKLSEVK